MIGADDRARLAKLFALVGGSEHAGERDNALAAIGKVLAGAGSSWSWITELIETGVHASDPEAIAWDEVLSRLVGDRLREAMGGAWSLSLEERRDLTKVNVPFRTRGSVRNVRISDISRALDIADQVRQRVR
jgi:hypothetical protein